ncbi:hypothetical protein DIPPA_63742 [Diplonema papillatum]|nr:hypothetical protein DIPPA_63742 [Diplonema papillatum]
MGFALGTEHKAQDSNSALAAGTHAKYNKFLTAVTLKGWRLTEAKKLPLGGPGHCLEVDEFSVGLKKRGQGAQQEYCYIRFVGIVDRVMNESIIRELPEKWSKGVGPGVAVELPSGCGTFTNTKTHFVVPPPAPISFEELDTILKDENLIELGTRSDPLYISTDGARTYRSRFDPVSDNFFWRDVPDARACVRYAWVNHGTEEFTREVASWVEKIDGAPSKTFGQDLNMVLETDVIAAIHSGNVASSLSSEHASELRSKYVLKGWVAGTQAADGLWGRLKRLLKIRGSRTGVKAEKTFIEHWRMSNSGQDIFHMSMIAVGEALKGKFPQVAESEPLQPPVFDDDVLWPSPSPEFVPESDVSVSPASDSFALSESPSLVPSVPVLVARQETFANLPLAQPQAAFHSQGNPFQEFGFQQLAKKLDRLEQLAIKTNKDSVAASRETVNVGQVKKEMRRRPPRPMPKSKPARESSEESSPPRKLRLNFRKREASDESSDLVRRRESSEESSQILLNPKRRRLSLQRK